MFSTLEFVMVACLFADLVVSRGAQFVAWVKGEVAVVENDVKKV